MEKMYVVETASVINPQVDLIVGVGKSRKSAIADAYGPKGKLPYFAWVREVSHETEPDLFESIYWTGK